MCSTLVHPHGTDHNFPCSPNVVLPVFLRCPICLNYLNSIYLIQCLTQCTSPSHSTYSNPPFLVSSLICSNSNNPLTSLLLLLLLLYYYYCCCWCHHRQSSLLSSRQSSLLRRCILQRRGKVPQTRTSGYNRSRFIYRADVFPLTQPTVPKYTLQWLAVADAFWITYCIYVTRPWLLIFMHGNVAKQSMCSHEALTHGSCGGKEVRMIAALLEVHHDIEQRHLGRAAARVQRLKVTRQYVLVVLPATSNITTVITCSTPMAHNNRSHYINSSHSQPR